MDPLTPHLYDCGCDRGYYRNGMKCPDCGGTGLTGKEPPPDKVELPEYPAVAAFLAVAALAIWATVPH